jgi:thioredoxin reductase
VLTTSAGFDIVLDSGRTVAARRLLIATGLTDELPEVPGVRERWGRDVLHCPYCHGYEVRDQPIGVLGSSPRSAHQALLVRQLSADVVFFRHTLEQLSAEDAAAPASPACGQLAM